MSALTRTDLKDKFNNASTGIYKTGQSRGIGSDDHRTMIEDVADSSFNLDTDAYTGAKGLKNSVNTIAGLQAIVTTSLTVPFYTIFRDTSNGNVLRVYELVTGTDAESSPDIIRPSDYAASTNEKVWKLAVQFTYESFAVTASGTDTYTAALSPAIAAYATNQKVYIKFTNANTGASTINLNSLGAKAIVKSGSTALSAGDISAGQVVCMVYDGTNFQIIGGGSGGGSSQPFSDGSALVKNSGDATKLGTFSASGITTGTTRTYSLPDYNGTLLLSNATNILAGTTTITSNARNQLIFSGTWTSTVTGDYHVNWGGSITALSGGSNTLNYMTITPTITANNNGQILNTLVINPTYSVGAYTGTSRNHLQLGDATVGTVFQQSPDNASRGLNIESKSTWESYAFRFGTGSNNASSGNRNGILVTGTFNPSSGTAAFAQLQLNYSINQSGGTGVIRGFYYNPSVTAAINHTAIQTTAGRLAFNMTGNPSEQVQFRSVADSTASHILIEDSSQVQKVLILDNGDIRIGAAADYTRIRNSASGGNTKGLEFESLSGHLTYAFRFNIAGVSGSQVNGNFDGVRIGSTILNNSAYTNTYNELLITTDLDVTSASATETLRHIKIDSNINCTAGTTTVRAFDYDPTVASSTGLTHYGITIRPTGVLNGFGTGTPTAIMDLAAGTTAYASLRIRTGVAPSSPNDGDIWQDGTDIKIRIGGVTKVFTLV